MADDSTDAGTRITRRDFEKIFNRATGAVHTFALRGFRGHILEVEDVHFHHDSAVLLPDFRGCTEGTEPPPEPEPDPDNPTDPQQADRNQVTGLAVIRAAYRHAEANPAQKILVAGHADRSGPSSYNLKLSKQRADNVFHILKGNRDDWVTICLDKHKVEDYQQIFKWVARIWGWPSDPGEVDNIEGPKTKEATKGFQATFNEEFDAEITVDGVVGKQTWGAVFDVYERVLLFITEVDLEGLKAKREGLKFLDEGRKTVGCGETHPITDPRRENFRSPIDRRVEILFFDPGAEPRLDCHPGGTQCKPKLCEIYDDETFEFEPIPCEPIPPPVPSWVVRIMKPAPPEPAQGQSGSGGAQSPPKRRLVALANEAFTVTGSGDADVTGTTDAEGVLRVKVVDDPATMTLKIVGLTITLNGGSLPTIESGDDADKHRLFNLGYGKNTLAEWDAATLTDARRKFRQDHDLPEDASDADTRRRLKSEHGS